MLIWIVLGSTAHIADFWAGFLRPLVLLFAPMLALRAGQRLL
jgi:hypothetical protein